MEAKARRAAEQREKEAQDAERGYSLTAEGGPSREPTFIPTNKEGLRENSNSLTGSTDSYYWTRLGPCWVDPISGEPTKWSWVRGRFYPNIEDLASRAGLPRIEKWAYESFYPRCA